MELKHVPLERVNLFTVVYGAYEIWWLWQAEYFQSTEIKNQGRLAGRFCSASLQVVLRHVSKMTPPSDFYHLSLSCLQDKQENLKECTTADCGTACQKVLSEGKRICTVTALV